MKKASLSLISVVIMVLGLFHLGYAERGIQVQEKRFALVIGNGNYKSSPLRNPTNDAHDMALVLKTMGFEVTHLENAGYRAMERAIRQFGKQLSKGGAGLFYFAGHGIQVNGRNYLIPVDAEIETESDVRFEAVDAGRVLGKMEDAGNELNIVILDACRDNPFARSFRGSNQGLARMDAPKGSLIAYATAPGSVAADGEGRNGVYTKHLIENAMTPGLTVEQVLKKVRIEVLKETNSKQVPWESSSLTGNFYFNPERVEVQPAVIEQQKTTKTSQEERLDKDYETLFWDSIKGSKNAEAFKAYLKKFPNGVFAELARINIKKYSQQIEEEPAKKFSSEHQKIGKDGERISIIKEPNLSKNNNIIDKKHEEGKSELIVTIKYDPKIGILPAKVYLRKKTYLNNSEHAGWVNSGKTPLKTRIDSGLYDIKIIGYSSGWEYTYSKEINIEVGKRVSIEAEMRWEMGGTPSSAKITVSDL